MEWFIVLELFNRDHIEVVTHEDGTTKYFTDEVDAKAEAELCQDGKVIRID